MMIHVRDSRRVFGECSRVVFKKTGKPAGASDVICSIFRTNPAMIRRAARARHIVETPFFGGAQ
jgi:hypothetical protein